MGRGLSVHLRRTDNPYTDTPDITHHGDGSASQCPGPIGTRTNLLFTMSYRTGDTAEAMSQTFFSK